MNPEDVERARTTEIERLREEIAELQRRIGDLVEAGRRRNRDRGRS